jgi:hypothetical protein
MRNGVARTIKKPNLITDISAAKELSESDRHKMKGDLRSIRIKWCIIQYSLDENLEMGLDGSLNRSSVKTGALYG